MAFIISILFVTSLIAIPLMVIAPKEERVNIGKYTLIAITILVVLSALFSQAIK